MSPQEIKALIDTVSNSKHRAIIMLLYSSGMRVSEIANLKITDIDSPNMRIKVVQGKGAKDRYTILSQQVLLELRAYYLIYKPKQYLFNGQGAGKPSAYATSSTWYKRHSLSWVLTVSTIRCIPSAIVLPPI